jgi:hypothetical protein
VTQGNLPTPMGGIFPFEDIRHEDEQGEYWMARELMPLLEYHKWQDFKEAIDRAIADCAKSQRSVEDNFTQSRKNSEGAGRPSIDYRLTRYACRLIVMAARTSGQTAALARTYFSDRVDEAELLADPDAAIMEFRRRAILALVAAGYSPEWAERRVDDITARNELTHEWVVRGIQQEEIPILTNELHMGAFGLSIAEHKGIKGFPVTYKGKKVVYKGDLPPAMTATELALNALASTVSRELHVTNDSQGYADIHRDVQTAGEIVGHTREEIERATGHSVVSPRNMLKEPDGGLWGQLPSSGEEDQ